MKLREWLDKPYDGDNIRYYVYDPFLKAVKRLKWYNACELEINTVDLNNNGVLCVYVRHPAYDL